ncbi:hypothetical protein, variant 1 [Aphanomyces invadans]|uniref:ribonuclease Z n=1 Tax=Aphanomyces invadans TaxID=157072 RepID=A0A024UT68_9STRA|nr:hypothetical protein, variant 1 [Aphanomyces invadans]ETW09117.1 hypothetical protein, variant 1 [Aphanomyces invadans]|eukprot:XP_008862923.1 hypothetical protein, variant 1 [Aphanomyces invadans]
MPVDIQVLSVASTEMSPAIIVTDENQRYLFNAGEGLQRLCMEHRVRLAKLHHVCLTEIASSTVGGLPGLILTVSDTGKKGLNVFGPTGTKAFFRATRHFLHRPAFAMEVQDLTTASPKVVQNESMALQPVVVDDAVDEAAPATTSGSPTHKRAKTSTAAPISVSYIVETPTQRGKFLIQKALALGVPKGPLCGKLHRGEDVVIDVNGASVTVKSIDCVSTSSPGVAFAIVACPTIGTIASLTQKQQFASYQQPGAVVKMSLLVHLGNAQVLKHPQYIQWVQSFGAQTQHILVNHKECPQWTVFRASATLQTQLHDLFPSNYAAPHHEVAPMESISLDFGEAIVGQPLLKYTLTPAAKQGIDRSGVMQPLNLHAIQLDAQQMLAEAKIDLNGRAVPSPNSELGQGHVTFLGTGSAIPSKYRNVTSNLIAIGSSFLLLDSGEGCFGQLFRSVGGDKAKLTHLLENLHVVWISHNHADHHLGLVRLLSERSLALPPLAIIGPTAVFYWLEDYSKIDASIVGKYIFENNTAFDIRNQHSPKDLDPFGIHMATIRGILATHYDIVQFDCIPVKHCFQSFAVVFTCLNGFVHPPFQAILFHVVESFLFRYKVAFSGDCRPSQLLVEHAKDADVLIHEATFEDGMMGEAKKKDHSTTEEAIDVGIRANAKHILLTHFSQRYPKMPHLSADALERVMTALDLMSLPFHALHVPSMMRVCQALMPMGGDVVDDDA